MTKDIHQGALEDFNVLKGRHIERLRVGWSINSIGYISGFGRYGGCEPRDKVPRSRPMGNSMPHHSNTVKTVKR